MLDHEAIVAARKVFDKANSAEVAVQMHRSAHPDWPDLALAWLRLPDLGVSICIASEEVKPATPPRFA